MAYYIACRTVWSFSDAVSELTKLLGEEEFGVLTEIDVRATFKDKLDIEFRPYKILGTCNARLAQQAIELEPAIGALMPCNWTIQQLENGVVEISVMDPVALSSITMNNNLTPVIEEVSDRVNRILSKIKQA